MPENENMQKELTCPRCGNKIRYMDRTVERIEEGKILFRHILIGIVCIKCGNLALHSTFPKVLSQVEQFKEG